MTTCAQGGYIPGPVDASDLVVRGVDCVFTADQIRALGGRDALKRMSEASRGGPTDAAVRPEP